MDAREYLARKGLDGERDKERPNTLEEKAWFRARESGDHRPKAGTPHDWEDWERYHDTLADGAEALEQKIDHEAHRQAEDPEQRPARAAESDHSASGVEHFTPAASQPAEAAANMELPADAAADAAQAQAEPYAAAKAQSTPDRPEPFAAIMLLAVLMPPLAMILGGAGARRAILALVLMLLCWLPGVVYAVVWLWRR